MDWRDTRGFTLVEVILTSVIIGLLLGGVYTLLSGGMRSWQVSEGRIDVQQNVRIAVSRIVREIREARQVHEDSDAANLFLVDREGRIIWYYLHSSGDLRRAVKEYGGLNFGGHNPVASNLKEVSFSYNRTPIEESTLVTVRVTGVDSRGKEFTLYTQARLRVSD
ncbi:prepilin-type N-terminal cleavage/methylation domain-containing protein [Calderihabitans maritimus]|uniref:Prepilin-type N-terminal cleavage/methylation domain-containing protein n=1 Tax=Calderihabitans maritimus TaxID=1246530 RepID=A0A1Z5HXP6_9FIRM|nr:prepilin-type N-terminal cleavage/methylation domain-containing protein [Calderihabitans maritimus]GAW94137.1 hypothetical protein Moth_1547 [Calderihabitans maritimus]